MNKEDLTINIRGRLYPLGRKVIMGIINVTPDSFYSDSRTPHIDAIRHRAEDMRRSGADWVDIGGYSTRPGAAEVSPAEELDRLARGIGAVREVWPDAVISVDTFRADVARECVRIGADIINDISGGTLDPGMWSAIAEMRVPYVLMHTRGTPATMQSLTDYTDVTADVLSDMMHKVAALHALGVADIILDPGFGFAKTTEQNYRLLANLRQFADTGLPVLAGLSRKSMIWKPLDITPAMALPGTIALNTAALLNGADIVRVHDVPEARQMVEVINRLIEADETR